MFKVLHTHNHYHHDDARLDSVEASLSSILEKLMAISAEVQKVLDAAAALPNIAQAINAGFSALQAQVTTLQGQINSTPSLSSDDKAALTTAATDIANMVAALPQNIMQGTGTPAPTNPAPTDPGTTPQAAAAAVAGTSPAS